MVTTNGRKRWQWWLGIVAALSVTLFGAGAASGPVNAATSGTVTADQQDANVTKELAERLLGGPPAPDGKGQTVQLIPGKLPGDMGVEIPVPRSGRLLGSLVRSFGAKNVHVDVVLDVPGPTAQIAAFYQDAFGKQGFTPTPDFKGGPAFGFQPTLVPTFRTFCHGSTPPWISLGIVPSGASVTDVRVQVDKTNAGPCLNRGLEPYKGPPGADKMPPLFAPDGVQLQPNGPGGAPNRVSSAATAITAMSVAALEAEFARQLEAAHWTRTGGRTEGPLSWSSWRVPGDGTLQGFLYVLQSAATGQRDLYLQLESSTPFSAPDQPFPAMPGGSGGATPGKQPTPPRPAVTAGPRTKGFDMPDASLQP
ncbi:MAG: hypothetical protein NVS2B7_15630 [Herpetosiphon sp.]